MKKRFVLLALPVLMALSACSGHAVQPKEDEMKEDTLLHEEIFGSAEDSFELAPRRLGDPDETPAPQEGDIALRPKVGVQFDYNESTDKYAVRFVAAIAGLNLTATWTRCVSVSDGNALTNFAMSDSLNPNTTAYRNVNDGGVKTPATSEGEGYNYYVVYTLYNIPANRKNYYVAAYLTLSDGNPAHDLVSKVVAAQLSGKHYFSFNENKNTGFFIQGVINGSTQVRDLDDDRDAVTDHAQETLNLKENDEFGYFYYERGSAFKYFGYENVGNASTNNYYLETDDDSDYIKFRAKAGYTLFVNGSDEFYIGEPVNPTVTLYFHPGINWSTDNPKFALWYNGSWLKFKESATAGAGYYEAEGFDFLNSDGKVLVFARYNPADDEPHWGETPAKNVYNQSRDETYPKTDRPNKKVANIYDDHWNYAWVSWTVLS